MDTKSSKPAEHLQIMREFENMLRVLSGLPKIEEPLRIDDHALSPPEAECSSYTADVIPERA